MNLTVIRTILMLRDLEEALPGAVAFGKLDEWANLYTAGYMLKLRAMR